MKNKIKFGVVGLGHIGMRHVKCIMNNTNSKLSVVCDVENKKEWCSTNQHIKYLSSFDELVKEDIDVLNICTPNYLHAKMAIRALSLGKHVVIEKPIALSTEDAQEIISASKKYKKSVFGVMQNRFSPTVIWLKEIIKKSLLGKINLIIVNCFWNRNDNYYLNSAWHGSKLKDGGPLFTQFSHFIDVINWIFGDFSNISAEFNSFRQRKYIEFEDSGVVKFDLQNTTSDTSSIRATLTYSTSIWNKNFESSITVLGEYGTVKIGGQYMDKIVYCDIKDYKPPNIDSDITCNDYGDYKGSASNHNKMIDNVVKTLMSLHGTNKVWRSSGSVDVVNIIERIYSFRN